MRRFLNLMYAILMYLGVSTLIIFIGMLAIADEPMVISNNLSTKLLCIFLLVYLVLITGKLNDIFKQMRYKYGVLVICLIVAVLIISFSLS